MIGVASTNVQEPAEPNEKGGRFFYAFRMLSIVKQRSKFTTFSSLFYQLENNLLSPNNVIAILPDNNKIEFPEEDLIIITASIRKT